MNVFPFMTSGLSVTQCYGSIVDRITDDGTDFTGLVEADSLDLVQKSDASTI